MIYEKFKDVKVASPINDLIQVEEDIKKYETYFPVEEGDVVMDIGAHVGLFTKRHRDKAKKVYSIEPDKLFFERAEDHPNVDAIRCAIGPKDGTMKLVSDGNANAINEKEGDDVDVVKFKTLISSLGIEKIDFLKIDCEGGEYDILNEENIEWIKNNVRKVAGEFHIHKPKHKVLFQYALVLLEENEIPYILTTLDGVMLSKEQIIKEDRFTEILFYFRTDEDVFDNVDLDRELVVNYHFVNGPYLEIISGPALKYNVKFINTETNTVLYETELGNAGSGMNNTASCFYRYYIPWKIVISTKDKVLKVIDTDLKDKRVFICLDSRSLGDSLAWMPYAEEFRKKHDCKLVLATFNNELFERQYPEIEFVKPGDGVPNIIAQYNIGWYYDENNNFDVYKNPLDFRHQPMQKTATDILGLEYTEIKPRLNLPKVAEETTMIGIGFHSTAQAKYWNNPTGWQDVCDHLKQKGFTPVILSKEEDGYMGNKFPIGASHVSGMDLQSLINYICKCRAFIGVGSGLTWLAWACHVPTILISGFSEPFTEMQHGITRISTPTDKRITSGCFNKYRFDAGNWHWYEPKQFVGTARQYECSKSITSETVIDAINQLLKIK